MYHMVCVNALCTRGVNCFCTVSRGLLPVKSLHITSKRAMFAKGVDYFCDNDKLNIKSTKNASPL